MITLIDLVKQIMTVQEIINSVEVKGVKNTAAITKAYDLCEGMISDLKETAEEIQNGSKEVGDNDG